MFPLFSRRVSILLLSLLSSILVFSQDKFSGTASVSPTGGAVYSIPFEVPKGVGDLRPSIGLSYSSQSGNGLAGFGCNVTGLSVITRGMKDIAHDSTVQGPQYSTADAYYLDGKRLVLVSGTAGSGGAVYTPEGEPLTTVQCHSAGPSIVYFTVDTGDGMTYEYGRNTDARQQLYNPFVIATWYIDEASNPLGQTITYQYTSTGSGCSPSSISYGSGNTVSFEYENRPDTIHFVLRNTHGYISQRLKTVTAKVDNSIYRKYTLTYNTTGDGSATKYSRLTSVAETGENGSSIHNLAVGWEYLPNVSPGSQDMGITVPEGNSNLVYGDRYFVTGDLNADGVSDVIHLASATEYAYSNGGQNFYTHAHVYMSQVSNGAVSYGNYIRARYYNSVPINDWSFLKGRMCIADIDGDGINDLLLPEYNSAGGSAIFYFYVFYGREFKESQFSQHTPYLYPSVAGEMPFYDFSDFNADAKADLILLEKGTVNGKYTLHWADCQNDEFNEYTTGLSLTSSPKFLFTADYNHDGLTDIMVVCDDGSRIFYNQGGASLSASTFVDSSTLNTSVTAHARMEQGDFNGDGIPDLIWNDNGSSLLYFELGNGDGAFTRHLAHDLGMTVHQVSSDVGTWSCMPVDLDHDGKTDIVLNVGKYGIFGNFQETRTYWLRSNGTQLTELKRGTSNREDDAKAGHVFAGDFTGQGYLEVANYGYDCYNGTNADVDPTLHVYRTPAHGISNGKAVSFTDSNGRRTSFTYASMASDLVYTKGTGSHYPVFDVAAPLCVTSRVSESGGSAITAQTDYAYAGLRTHVQGRGLLGFRGLTATDANSGKTVVTTTSNDDATFLVPTRTTTVTTQGGYTSTVVADMTLKSFNYGTTGKNYMLYPTSQTATDIYGNVTETTRSYNQTDGRLLTERSEDDGGSAYRETTYGYPAAKVAGAWRPTSITQTQKCPGNDALYTDVTQIAYNSNGLKTAVVEHAGKSLGLTTAYTYDTHGNMTRQTITGSGISPALVTEYQYDTAGRFMTKETASPSANPIATAYTRNAFGDIMAQTVLSGTDSPQTTTYTRNGFGTVTDEVSPAGVHTSYLRSNATDYGSAYSIKVQASGRPAVTTWYDALDNETHTETTGIGDVSISTTTARNARGEVTAKTSTHGNLTLTDTYTYDGLGRLAGSTTSNGGTVTYSYSNRTVTTTENGRSATKTYDAWGHVTQADDQLSSVTYVYHPTGKPLTVTSEGSTVVMSYDAVGNQTELHDPDAGIVSYEYDALGRVKRQTDARGKETTFTYDAAGRTTQKTAEGVATTYTYGTSGNGTGRLVSEQTADRTIAYTYDDKGRLSQETRSMSGSPTLIFGYGYDEYDRLVSRSYPQGITVGYVFDSAGHQIASTLGGRNIGFISKDDGQERICQLGGVLRYGFLLNGQPMDLNPLALGGGMSLQSLLPEHPEEPIDTFEIEPIDTADVEPFDSLDNPNRPEISYYTLNTVATRMAARNSKGYLTYIRMHQGSDASLMTTQLRSMAFSFENGTGNLLYRTGMTSQQETFTYDELDRLASVSKGGVVQQNVGYADNGNITSKTGLGSFSYGTPSQRPHAVMAVDNPLGSISSATQTATYTDFGKVLSLSDNGYQMDFTYGPDEERWKTVLRHNGSVVRTTLYADGYECITEGGVTRHLYYLDDGVIYVLEDGETEGQFYYAFTDHLGSITALYDSTATAVFEAEYDAWGRQTVTTDAVGFHWGYTGHEMLPEFGLINMNGRLYDPILGRFLSPDNYVQMPDFSQSFNRYSYCLNNPLKYTDPSGEYFLIDDIIAGFIGGTMNLIGNIIDGNVHNFSDGIAAFGSGAVGGVGALYPQFGGLVWGGAVVGGTNAALAGAGFDGIIFGSVSGVASSLISGGIGKFASGYLNKLVISVC